MAEEHIEGKRDAAKREEAVLKFWENNKIFEKSEEKPAPKGEFVFYDGPPFATGLPHYGHILAGTVKDAIPRYKTMRGFRVRRRWGWDCHGLPLENEIEKELGLRTKRDIEKLGVGRFNEAARKAVLRYADDWKKIVPRLGRWVDMERDYRTMDASYTESVWWVFNALYKKGLIHEDFKSMHLCPRCGTTLSNFEVQQGYKDVEDISVIVEFPLSEDPRTSLLVWTTTPWTLPGNMAAAVHRDCDYVTIEKKDEGVGDPVRFIVAKERLEAIFGNDEYTIVAETKGEELVGKSYIPPFDYYKDVDLKEKENAWKIYHAPYVSLEEGTGAVHLAPAYGEEDMELAKTYGIPIVHHVGEDGRFLGFLADLAGQSAKPRGDKERDVSHLDADVKIVRMLKERGVLFESEKMIHSYPHCWRCDTPLLNYAATSWFVKVTDIRDQLVAENRRIRWVPKEVGEKRFGNWLENARDWAISRARYWGAPLPVWRNEKTGAVVALGSVDELKKHTKRSGNRYFLMRHGEAESNTRNLLNADAEVHNPLTEQGIEHVRAGASKLLDKGVGLIVHSPLQRTRETAMLLAKGLGLPEDVVKEDARLREVTFGEFEGCSIEGYHSFFAFARERMIKRPEGGETWTEVKRRMTSLLYELEERHSGKIIVIVSHNGPLQMIQAGGRGYTVDICAKCIADNRFDLAVGEVRELDFVPLPHNEEYELDLHRPYIDDLELVDEDGTRLRRVPEVFDCWFESGSMPYGQHHYPFENADIFEPKGGWFKKARGYPADFIAEGLDQTRGWFYSLLVLGVALFGRSPYKNVIVNGLVLAEDGQKMSKRLRNYPDPMDVAGRYGADALRYYLLSSPVVRGEDLNFSEKGVEDIERRLIRRLMNVLSFYTLYSSDGEYQGGSGSSHVLDRWILARTSGLVEEMTQAMERYELDRATRPLADFIDDLSTWYLRRSRERFKGKVGEDKARALQTTRYVLTALSRLLAPFMPFYAEALYQEVRERGSEESVHLTPWPSPEYFDRDVLGLMRETRTIVSLALEARAGSGIKVRQPLQTLKMKVELPSEFVELVKDEVNVKDVLADDSLKEPVVLDVNITPELRDEGAMRELTRHVQDLRKRAGLLPSDRISIAIDTGGKGREIIERHNASLKAAALADDILFERVSGEELRSDPYMFVVKVTKRTP